MSVLRSRLMSGNKTAPTRPYGTEATPMEMPLATVRYDKGTLTYADLVPAWTGDVNAAPVAAEVPGAWGRTAAAGRP